MTPGDFSFRVSCYEQLHFSPDDIGKLTLGEAERLAVYFSETAKKQWSDRKDQERQASMNSTSSSGQREIVEHTFGGDGRPEEDY